MSPNFGEPDADWTDEYPWTRYRGPQPWPTPADWVLRDVEADGTGWYRYPGLAEGLHSDHEVVDLFDADEYDELDDARAERATLMNRIVNEGSGFGTEHDTKYTFSIGGTDVFARVEPDFDDLLATVAEVMARYSGGEDLKEIDATPSTGRPPQREVEENNIEKRKESNHSLADFDGGNCE